MRAAVEVKPAGGDDIEAIAELCLKARQETVPGSQVCGPDAAQLMRQLSVLDSLPGSHLLVADQDGSAVGFVAVRVLAPHLYADKPSLYIEALYVDHHARRRGVGHALLSHAAELAEAAGATEVYSVPIPGARGVQRFLARLGFAPVAGHRWVATAVLQRRLAGETGAARRRGRSLDDIIARRRRARGEVSGPVDLRDFQADYRSGEPLAH